MLFDVFYRRGAEDAEITQSLLVKGKNVPALLKSLSAQFSGCGC